MVRLTGQKTEVSKCSLNVASLGEPKTAWFLEEQVEKYYRMDMCHDGGFEGESHLTYILFSEESARDLFSRLVERRKKEGWKVQDNYFPHWAELRRYVGDSECRIKYHLFGQNTIFENGRN